MYKQNFNPESYADAGLVLDEFFHLCHLAGPARCAFWAVSPAAIRDAFWALDARIHTAPVPSRAGVLNWSLWHAGVFRQLYYPLTGWDAPDGPAVLAASLANGSFSAQPAPGAGGNVSSSGATTAVSAVTPLVDPQTGRRNGKEIIMLVQCADAPPYSIRDVRDYEGMLRRSEELGPFVPDGVASDGLVCGSAFFFFSTCHLSLCPLPLPLSLLLLFVLSRSHAYSLSIRTQKRGKFVKTQVPSARKCF